MTESARHSQLSPLALLYLQALRSQGDEAVLEALRRNAPALREWLARDSTDSFLAAFAAVGDVHPEWLARVYEALAGPTGAASADLAWDTMVKKYQLDEWNVGVAFAEILLAGTEMKDEQRLAERFAKMPAPEHVQRSVATYPDVRGAGARFASLARCGLTPTLVWGVTSGIAPLVRRWQRHEKIPDGTPARLLSLRSYSHLAEAPPADLPETLLRKQIVQTAHCTVRVAEALWDWLLELAADRPCLFAGGVAEVQTATAVTLRVNAPGSQTVITECWGLTRRMLAERFRPCPSAVPLNVPVGTEQPASALP